MPTTDEMLYGTQPPDWRPTLKQAQALHISAKAAGLGKGDVALFCWLSFGKSSTKELDFREYCRVENWIEKQT